MGGALGFARGALLADVQGTLGSERLREGTAAITLVIVVDVVTEQSTRSLQGSEEKEEMR